MGQGKDQADLIGTRIDLHLLGNADEASVVVVRKLDLLFQHVQAIKVSAFLGADSSHILAIAFRNHLCSNGRVFNDSHFHILQFFQEVAALSERLFVGEDLLDIGEGSSRLCHQIVADAQTDAFGNMEVVVLHQVVNGTDGTVRAVFDGQDPVLAKAFFNSIEYALKAVEIHDARHFKEFLAGSLRVGSCNALAGNDCLFREEVRCFFQCFFDAVSQVGSLSHIVVLAGTAGVKNRIEQQPCISVERFTDLFGYFMQNFFLALVREDGYFVAFLILSDFQGFFHSFFEQVGQLFIYIVYVLSHLI